MVASVGLLEMVIDVYSFSEPLLSYYFMKTTKVRLAKDC